MSSPSSMKITCSAIPENLMESEFFGHRKGAFTGALADHDGFFQAASGGTLWPVEQLTDQGAPIKRFDLYYQALWFRALLGVLAANLLVCTWRTLRRTLGEQSYSYERGRGGYGQSLDAICEKLGFETQ